MALSSARYSCTMASLISSLGTSTSICLLPLPLILLPSSSSVGIAELARSSSTMLENIHQIWPGMARGHWPQEQVNVLTLTLYDWVPIPLVYTQVVNLAVRAYFLVALMGRQYLVGERELPGKANVDLVVPIMTILQFLFYMGWMKVAEVLLNPMGEDDEDFETNWIIDRNLQVGLCIVDDCYGRLPALEKDQFWEQSKPQLLYTKESAARRQNPQIGSCNDTSQQEDALLLPPSRHRLMSTAVGPELGGRAEGEGQVVPVHNHNPARRISVVHNAFAESGPSRLLATVKRKFSRAPNSRRGSTDLEGTFERSHIARSSAQSVASNGEASVQHFLWGGKTKSAEAKEQLKIQSENGKTDEQPKEEPVQKEPMKSGGLHHSQPLAAIQEEEAGENGDQRGDGASSTSMEDAVSSTSSSSGPSRKEAAEKGREHE